MIGGVGRVTRGVGVRKDARQQVAPLCPTGAGERQAAQLLEGGGHLGFGGVALADAGGQLVDGRDGAGGRGHDQQHDDAGDHGFDQGHGALPYCHRTRPPICSTTAASTPWLENVKLPARGSPERLHGHPQAPNSTASPG